MIMCLRCDNETRTTEMLTAGGSLMVAGPAGSTPQPVLAALCVACGFIQLFGPQPIDLQIARQPAAADTGAGAPGLPSTPPIPVA